VAIVAACQDSPAGPQSCGQRPRVRYPQSHGEFCRVELPIAIIEILRASSSRAPDGSVEARYHPTLGLASGLALLG